MSRISTKKYRSFILPNFFKKNLGGFALLELLIIITIIGILAGIVLVAFSSARKQAKETRISSDMLQVQNIAENIYLDDGDYNNVDPVQSPEIAALESDIVTQGGSSLTIKKPSPAGKYCAYSHFSSPPELNRAFCVDYQGSSFKTPLAPLSCSDTSYFLCAPCLDANSDGYVDVAGLMSYFDCGSSCDPPEPDCFNPAFDFNFDGCIDVLDAIKLSPYVGSKCE